MDDFHRYWQSWTKIFDFVITLTCIFQLGLDVWMSGKSLEALEQVKLSYFSRQSVLVLYERFLKFKDLTRVGMNFDFHQSSPTS